MTERRLPALDRLAVFDAVARHRSFTRAGAERFLTQSAVSRQVAALEDELGARLFHRRHRTVELTDDGALLAQAVAQALSTVRDAVVTIRAPSRREVLALTTTPGLASLWLIPRLASFIDAHPGIDVRIDATHDQRDLAVDGFDIAIRYGRLGATEGDPLFEESVQPVCAPSLLRGRKALKQIADLAHHTLLTVAMPSGQAPGMPLDWQAWLRAVGAPDLEPAASLTFTNFDTAVAAALEGQGVLLGRRPLLDRLLAKRRLVAPFKGRAASARGYFLIIEAQAATRPAAQALRAWLLDEAGSTGA